jgi:hypothetical protein
VPFVVSVGPEGLEPSPRRLRAGDAAANTSVPCCSIGAGELNPDLTPYKVVALTTELRASSGAGGIRTHTVGLKVRVLPLHHDPNVGVAYPFAAPNDRHCVSPVGSKFEVSGSPGNRTQRNSVISRVWATSPRLPCKSGASESNGNPPAPKAGVLPSAPPPELSVRTVGLEPTISWPPAKRDTTLRHVLITQHPVRESNPHLRIESPLSLPLDQRGVLCAHRVRKVGREALESSSAVLQTAAIPSQLPAQIVVESASSIGRSQRKRPDVAVTPGLVAHQRERPSVNSAFVHWGARSPSRHSPDWQIGSSMDWPPAISA